MPKSAYTMPFLPLRTRDVLVDTDAELSRSRRIVNALRRNVVYNKLLLVLIIVLELVTLGALVYWKFFMK